MANFSDNFVKPLISANNAPEKIILVIAGNKSDLIEQETVDEGEARNFAKELNAIFISTSAKSSEGINNLFEEIAKKHTGATNISIAKGNVEEPHVEEKNDKVKIENPGKAKKQKKKGYFLHKVIKILKDLHQQYKLKEK